MNTLHFEIHSPQSDDITKVASILRDGGVVAIPTETVYGLGGDGLNKESSKKIYAAKGRPSDNPLIIHIADMVRTGSTIVLDYAETAGEGVSSYSYIEMATMLNFAGFDVYEYISPSDWAESWDGPEDVSEKEFDGVILAVKRVV